MVQSEFVGRIYFREYNILKFGIFRILGTHTHIIPRIYIENAI